MPLFVVKMGKVINPPPHFIGHDGHTPIGFRIDPFANRDAAVSTLHLAMLAVIGEKVAQVVGKALGLGHHPAMLGVAGNGIVFWQAVGDSWGFTAGPLVGL